MIRNQSGAEGLWLLGVLLGAVPEYKVLWTVQHPWGL